MNSAVIGRYIRLLRKRENMSQERLGELLNLSYQQVQKYELGQSRITVEFLSKISHIFLLSISEIIDRSSREFAQETADFSRPGGEYQSDGLREQELIREFRRLDSSQAKDLVLNHIKCISQLEKEISAPAAAGNDDAYSEKPHTEDPSSGTPDFHGPYSPHRNE
ncbi:MAG: helix-turn-helix domain-containing protein [Spirochaetaceae bacterium]